MTLLLIARAIVAQLRPPGDMQLWVNDDYYYPSLDTHTPKSGYWRLRGTFHEDHVTLRPYATVNELIPGLHINYYDPQLLERFQQALNNYYFNLYNYPWIITYDPARAARPGPL